MKLGAYMKLNASNNANQNPLGNGDFDGQAGGVICVFPFPGCSSGGRPVPPPAIPIPRMPDFSIPDGECYRYEFKDCKNNVVYVGITNNLERRVKEHFYRGCEEV